MSLHQSTPRDNELAELAYNSVKHVPTVEPNDRNRLGYHVWLFLRGEIPTLENAIHQARSRYQPKSLPISDVVAHIREQLEVLQAPGMSVGEKGLST